MPNCLECSSKEIYATGKCRRCYNRSYYRRWKDFTLKSQPGGGGVFASCHKLEKHYAKGLCRKCYDRKNMKQWRVEYDARRYKDRKLNKPEPKVQERVTHNVVPSPPSFVRLTPYEISELPDDEYDAYMQKLSDYNVQQRAQKKSEELSGISGEL